MQAPKGVMTLLISFLAQHCTSYVQQNILSFFVADWQVFIQRIKLTQSKNVDETFDKFSCKIFTNMFLVPQRNIASTF